MIKVPIHLFHIAPSLLSRLCRQGMLIPGTVYGHRELEKTLQKKDAVHVNWVKLDPNRLGQLDIDAPCDGRRVPATVDLAFGGGLMLLRHRLTARTAALAAALEAGSSDDPEMEALRKAALRRRRIIILKVEAVIRRGTRS